MAITAPPSSEPALFERLAESFTLESGARMQLESQFSGPDAR